VKTFPTLAKIKEDKSKAAGLPGVEGSKNIMLKIFLTQIFQIYFTERRNILVYLVCLRLPAYVIHKSLLTLKRIFLIISETCICTVL